MRHPYHLVEPSPWPFLISLNLLFFMLGFVSIFGGYSNSVSTYFFSLFMVISILLFWLYDIFSESFYLGSHPNAASKALISGFLLFVLTEVMLFFSLFWGYFHSALNPNFLVWPPIGIELINPWGVPLLNTLLLFYSGVAATLAHHYFISQNKKGSEFYLGIGIILGIFFVILQGYEYYHSSFDIADSIYGSSFFMLTGLHGFHVITGLIFLSIIWFRLLKGHIPNVIFDLGLLYYHFLDLVWILLFILIYYLAY